MLVHEPKSTGCFLAFRASENDCIIGIAHTQKGLSNNVQGNTKTFEITSRIHSLAQ
jgi:hypothetical protein